MIEVSHHPLQANAPIGNYGIRELRLARPPVNAFNTEMLQALIAAVEDAAKAPALLITGQPGLFSAGLDVRAILAMDRDAAAALFVELWRVQRVIAYSPMPVIFGLTGHSPAGGTVLAIHGDYRVMALGDFRMGLNEVQVGLFPGPVIHGAFRRLTGGHGAQLLTRGALIDPTTALRVGLVDELCEASQVAARALEVAREFCALPRDAMLRTRELARQDLHELFGDPGDSLMKEREFSKIAVEMWFEPRIQQMLKRMFTKPPAER
jgi:Delta3-Delta2-enoyl-CoA isomerase